MNSSERLNEILSIISDSAAPISGSALARRLGVSRQIIVKDIAALKEQGADIISTTKGYIIHHAPKPERVFKVVHKDDEIRTELEAIISSGGTVKDVFVWHKIYGRLSAELNIRTMQDINEYIDSLKNGRSSPLKNVTSEYHYHTVSAESEAALDSIGSALESAGFLVKDED